MGHQLFRRRSLCRGAGLAVLLAGIAASPALADSTPLDTSMCTAPALSQPFLSWQDVSWYALAPGQSADNFNGAGWALTGGARIAPATLANGATASVLELPSGSQAVSPTTCLTSDYPTARMMVRNLSGSNGGNISFSVSYAGTSSALTPQQTGTFKTTGSQGVSGSWMLAAPVDLEPAAVPGWQPMRIVLTPDGAKKSDFQIYNLYVDPRMRG